MSNGIVDFYGVALRGSLMETDSVSFDVERNGRDINNIEVHLQHKCLGIRLQQSATQFEVAVVTRSKAY